MTALDDLEILARGAAGTGATGYVQLANDVATYLKAQLAAIVGAELTDNLVYGTREITSGVNITLTSADSMLQSVTMSAASLAVILPDATTLVEGRPHIISNAGSNAFAINANGGGTVTAILDPGQAVALHLIDGATAAGVWLDAIEIDEEEHDAIECATALALYNLPA